MEEGSDREDVTPGARVKDILFVVRCTCLVFFFSFMNIFTPEDMRIIQCVQKRRRKSKRLLHH